MKAMSARDYLGSEVYRSNYAVSGREYSDMASNGVFFAQGCSQRTEAIDAYLARGAALVLAGYKDAPVSFEVEGRSFKPNHIQVARLVVFPGELQEEPPK